MSSGFEKPVIMVSSSVYRIEHLLERIYAVLSGYGYHVWMSHRGTVPVDPNKSAFENCLDAVDRCDLFLGLITTFYGTGKDGGDISIAHQELVRAIERNKLRWFLAHDHVPFARQLLRQFRFNEDGSPRDGFRFAPTAVLDDIRVVDMYEAATRHDMALGERTGNWVQPYFRTEDALEFISSQFFDRERITQMLTERNGS